MTTPRYRLTVAREQYKFSCAHMTVFPDGTKERLHGHNYTLAAALDVSDVSFAAMIPFAPIKAALAELCAAWRERVLVAEHNPFYRVVRDAGGELEFTLCGDRYVLPRGDVALVPIDNIAVEPLAAYLATELRTRLAAVLAVPHVRGLELTVAESPGQGASCYLPLG